MALTDRDWERIAPLIREPKRRRIGWVTAPRAAAGARRDPLGAPPAVRAGRICRITIRPIRPAIGASRSGRPTGPSSGIAFTLGEQLLARGRLDLRESAIDGTFASARGPARRQDEARQGHQDHDRERGARHSDRSDDLECEPERGDAGRRDARGALRERASAADAGRRGVRQRSARCAAGQARDRDDRAQPIQSARAHAGRRAFRRYRRRWKVERVNAWLQNFRRIVTRREYKAENFRAFVQLACICILLRQF